MQVETTVLSMHVNMRSHGLTGLRSVSGSSRMNVLKSLCWDGGDVKHNSRQMQALKRWGREHGIGLKYWWSPFPHTHTSEKSKWLEKTWWFFRERQRERSKHTFERSLHVAYVRVLCQMENIFIYKPVKRVFLIWDQIKPDVKTLLSMHITGDGFIRCVRLVQG